MLFLKSTHVHTTTHKTLSSIQIIIKTHFVIPRASGNLAEPEI